MSKCFYQPQQNRSYEWLPSREFSHSAANNVTPELILNKDIVLFDEDDDYEEHFQEAQLNEEACSLHHFWSMIKVKVFTNGVKV